MRFNIPANNTQCYLGFSPYSVGHAISKNLLNKSKFFDLSSIATPLHHLFWSDVEIGLVRELNDKFSFGGHHYPFLLEFSGIRLLIGVDFKSSLLELRRKFPRLELKIIESNIKTDSFKSLESDLSATWSLISKNSHVESVNFKRILEEINNPLISILIDWMIY